MPRSFLNTLAALFRQLYVLCSILELHKIGKNSFLQIVCMKEIKIVTNPEPHIAYKDLTKANK